MMDSYIGVTGFMSAAEVQAALEAFPVCGRRLMVGALASHKTLYGDGNSKPLRYPRPEAIADIFLPDPRCLNLIHYATGGEAHARGLAAALIDAFEHGWPNCHGLQVNAVWPNPDAFPLLAKAIGSRTIVLQVGPRAMYLHRNDPVAIVKAIGAYTMGVTDVLIDASGGVGKAIEVGFALSVLRAAEAAGLMRSLRFNVAGGLCAETVAAMDRVLAEYPDTGWDAEGRLRDDEPGGGRLLPEAVRGYLAESGRVVAAAEARKA
jgi:hypothetical protein